MAWPRVGLDQPERTNAEAAVEVIRRAESRGVPMVWAVTGSRSIDALTVFAAAAVQTRQVGLGTAIVPTYTRHPVALAQQAIALDQLAPGRFRLGIGPSHRPTIEGAYGIPMGRPLEHLREYLTVVRSLLWNGNTDFAGEYFRVTTQVAATARIPIYTSALRPNAFRLAGEIADGAISWMCPADYLLQQALPALQAGAERANRPRPRLVAHVPVVLTTDRARMLELSRPVVGAYGRQPFYAQMFATAGYPLLADGTPSNELLDHLVVWGDEEHVGARLAELLEQGIDELLAMLVPGTAPAEEDEQLAGLLARLHREFGTR
jgi:F420-dependent oxidoreductase-like protein